MDSLRGIAALMVMFQHLWEMNHNSDDRLRPWLFFCAGHEAVILFFILSGFVLSHQLREFQFDPHGCRNYAKFILKRIFRIYPAYYCSLLISALLLIYIKHYHPTNLTHYGLQPWFYIWSQTTFDITMWLGSVTLLMHEGNSLNVSTWSLYYEMWLSLVFPGLLWLICRSRYWFRLGTGLGLLAISYWCFSRGTFLDDQWQSIIYYGWYFILGMVLYQVHQRLTLLAAPGIFYLGLLLYFSNYLMFGKITNRMTHEIIIAIGCSIILLNCIYNPLLKRFLNWQVFSFYGKISYSFYLLHLPILYLFSYLLLEHNSFILVKILVFVGSTVAAVFSYYLVEHSGIVYINTLLKRRGKNA